LTQEVAKGKTVVSLTYKPTTKPKVMKKQKNTYQLVHASTNEWADIFITASNYDDARIEFHRVISQMGLNSKNYGFLRVNGKKWK
jgi:hypothetical protein